MADESSIPDLSGFLEALEEVEVKLKRPEKEIADICEAVEEMIESLLKNMGDRDPRFANLKDNLLKVGSFYGGTKIKEPDEFDYLVVLDDLPADVELVEHEPGFRHIMLKEGSAFYDKWKDVTDEYMQMINRGVTRKKRVNEVGNWHREGKQKRSMIGEGLIEFETGVRGLFYLCLHKSFDILKTIRKITKTTGYLDLNTFSSKFIMEKSWYYFEQRRTEIQLHGPATNICVRWVCNENPSEPLEITADISPAFRSRNIKETIRMDSIQDKYFHDALLNHGSFLIIPTSFRCTQRGLCFNVAHTETEGKLVKDLSFVHNRTYKLLKYIMNGGNMGSIEKPADPLKLRAFILIQNSETGIEAFDFFSSFALKTVVLQHSRICKENSDISKCITECLKHIRMKIFSAQPPSCPPFQPVDVTNVFDARQRVIGQKINKDIILTNCLKALDDVLILLYKGPYEARKLIPVNSGTLLYYIDSIDYSSETWIDRLSFRTKSYEILPITNGPDTFDGLKKTVSKDEQSQETTFLTVNERHNSFEQAETELWTANNNLKQRMDNLEQKVSDTEGNVTVLYKRQNNLVSLGTDK